MSNKIIMYKGTNKTYEATIRDKDGNLAVLTDAKIIFTATSDKESSEIAIQLKNTAAGGSSAEIENTDLPNGKFRIKFIPANTVNLPKERYVYDVQVTLSGKVYIVLDDSIKLKKRTSK